MKSGERREGAGGFGSIETASDQYIDPDTDSWIDNSEAKSGREWKTFWNSDRQADS